MAKFRSLFRVSGDIGDVNFYERDGQKYMRQTTSLDKERIETAPEFKRTRENNREFGGAAVMGKSLRVGLANVLKRYADGGFTSRLTRIFKQMQKAATTGERGKRPIAVLANKGKLVGKSLHKSETLEMVFSAPFTVTANAGRNEVTLDVPVFDIDALVDAPLGASHFKLVLVAACLSDHYYDADEGGYVPMDPDLSSLNAVTSSTALPLGTPMTAPVQLVATLPGNPTMTTTCGTVTCVGIEFYQEVAGVLYILAERNGMRVANIF